MAGIINKTLSEIYKDLFYIDNDNNGFTTTLKTIKDGAGNTSSLSLSDRATQIKANTDNTTALQVQDADGNALFTVDTTNDLVKAGINQQYANTQFAHFAGTAMNVDGSTHLCVPRIIAGATGMTLGTGTDPDTSLTISTTADDVISCMWYVSTAVTIDSVEVWCAGDASGNDTLRFHLMSYTIDNSNGSTGGDLTSGTVVASGADISSLGYEQAYFQSMTINSANIAAGKAVFFTIKGDSSNANYNVNVQIKYHL
tara:strand:+ start:168 stop:935 length:768 start_codon:yes stop_codon:yes gene_type:complete